ncbi:hypothetical protein BDY21DRAFT_370140 [Lineolata rhizophorae]|uniref:Endo-1,3(4)-beta-glucanase 1 carbohydrate binding domain-containing protein n=1 Tax=Lineolata rhizophorae TaxID=578093 RepID=A0A6A6P5U8_9PEZI|nr:hypothetical protein BDY21DRAFT_370140 [Lineolata rhizophorae]
MAPTTFLSALALLPVLARATPISATEVASMDLKPCGDAFYSDDAYTCYNDSQLCPIVFGELTVSCGDACYSSSLYTCEDGILSTLAVADGPFEFKARSANEELDGQNIGACGLEFLVGLEDPLPQDCLYCYNAPPLYECDRYENHTVLLPNGEMQVDVPGSQWWHIDGETGQLVYDRGGRGGNGPQHNGDVKIYENGYFAYLDVAGELYGVWLACPSEEREGTWTVWAPTEENMQKEDCEQIKITTSLNSDDSAGAYSYA